MYQEELPPYELSPDIEWLMLNSQRGDPERVAALLSILTDLVGKAAYWTALEMLGTPELARRGAAAGLLRMAAQGQRYRPDANLTAWACQAVVQAVWEKRRAWRTAEMLPPPQPDENLRLAALFMGDLALPAAAAAEILGFQPAGSPSLPAFTCPWTSEEAKKLLNECLTGVYASAAQDPAAPGPLRSVPVSLAEVVVVLSAVLGVALITWLINLINPDPAQPFNLAVLTPPVPTATPVPDWQATAEARRRTPLDENATIAQIQERIGIPPVENIWADAVITYLGPQGLDGNPVSWRVAFWFKNNAGWFLISTGHPDHAPSFVYLFRNWLERGIIQGRFIEPQAALVSGMQVLVAPNLSDESPEESARTLSEDIPEDPLPGLDALYTFFGESWISDPSLTVEKLPMKTIAGRPAVGIVARDHEGNRILEKYYDAEYGWLLQLNEYSRNNPGKLLKQLVTNRILFDTPFSEELTNPQFPILLGYEPQPIHASTNKLRPVPETGLPLDELTGIPPGFDLSQADLSYQHMLSLNRQTIVSFLLRIFAGPYWLGDLPVLHQVGQPFNCRRSVDGTQLVLEGIYAQLPEEAAAAVTVYDLQALAKAERAALAAHTRLDVSAFAQPFLLPLPEHTLPDPYDMYVPVSTAEDLAFSPDGTRLAVVTASWLSQESPRYYKLGGLYVADLTTLPAPANPITLTIPAVALLAPLEGGRSLTWSPDGSQLALIAEVYHSPDQRMRREPPSEVVWVLDAASGEMVFRQELNTAALPLVEKWFRQHWNIEFPRASLVGFEGCVSPPGP